MAVQWLANHQETQLWSSGDGDDWVGRLPQWSTFTQRDGPTGDRIPVHYFGNESVPESDGWVDAAALGPGEEPADGIAEPNWDAAPATDGRWLMGHRAAALWAGSNGGSPQIETAPQWSIYQRVGKGQDDRLPVYYFGNNAIAPGVVWVSPDDVGPIGEPDGRPPQEPRSGRVRPRLDRTAPVGAKTNRKPSPFQVINEFDARWHLDDAEYNANRGADCGPIAVAHAVNFTNWALGSSDTINAHDAIQACIADGAYEWGNQTIVPSRLAKTIERFTGVQVRYDASGLTWADALEIASTRWIIVNIPPWIADPGHISIVVRDFAGSEVLELVQHIVTKGGPGPLDAGNLIIDASEWGKWSFNTIYPLQKLWLAA